MTTIPQHPAAIANAYGIWFEITKKTIGNVATYEAFHLAWPKFLLKNWPMTSIGMYQLEMSEEPIRTIQQAVAAPASSPFENMDANEPQAQFSLRTKRGWEGNNPQHPRRDFFRINDSDNDEEEPKNNKYVRLEGIPPKEFNEDQSKTHQFLVQFKCFKQMNSGANIAWNSMSKALYFLSLLLGLKVVEWVEQQYNWLDKIETNPYEYPLPYGLNIWQVLEAKFKKAFFNYVAGEKAHNNLWKLKMQGGNVN